MMGKKKREGKGRERKRAKKNESQETVSRMAKGSVKVAGSPSLGPGLEHWWTDGEGGQGHGEGSEPQPSVSEQGLQRKSQVQYRQPSACGE